GQYKVTADAPGFASEEVTGVTLAVNQQARVNLTLKTGSTTTTVTVASQATELDTDNAAISQLVSSQQVTQLPLDGRNFTDLLFIGAGVTEIGGEQSGHPGAGDAISINGSRPESNNYLLDGIMNTDQTVNVPSTVLSIDAIQEFKVMSETYSAQYGMGANQISVVSRSGTNSFHGSLFEFDRNNDFDAENYFQSGPNTELRQNQFGFVVDGPVRIPWLYNGRDKTFFMANYEGERVIAAQNTGYTTVPTPAELAGDFTTSITDPTTGKPFPGGNGYASIIPPSRFSRLASVTIGQGFIPAPNCAGCGGNPKDNLSLPSTGTTHANQQTYRVDEDMHKWGRLFARGSYSTYKEYGYGGVGGPISGSGASEINTNWAVGHTLNIGPRMVNQFIMGRMDSYLVNYGYSISQSLQDALGLSNVFTNLTNLQRTYPTIAWNNQNGENLGGLGGANNAYTSSDNPMWQFDDAFTYIRGEHTVTVGADFKRWTLFRGNADNFLGEYTYGDATATGNEVADFLLGYYEGANGFMPAPLSPPGTTDPGNLHDYNFVYGAAFVQDDWKVDPRLTINAGMRWDFRPVPTSAGNRMGWIDPDNPLGGLCVADPALTTDGIAPLGNGYYRYCGADHPGKSEYDNFGPRAGGAYRVNAKTVVRAGAGMFWDGVEGREMDDSGDIYPYITRQNLSQGTGQPSYMTTDQLWPNYSLFLPAVPADNTFLAVIISNRPKNPFVTQWTLSVERELASNTTFEVDYIGNKGSNLLARQNINQALPMSNGPACYSSVTASEQGDCPLAERFPYPNFATAINSSWIGYSNYNALNLKFEHRAGQVAITSVYTWSKSMDDKSTAAAAGSDGQGWQGFLNNNNPQADYGRSDFNAGQRFVTSFVYELPVGRGKQFAGGANHAVNAVIGGWETTGIVTFQQGFPMSINCYDYDGASGVGGLLDIATGFGSNRCDQASADAPKKIQFTLNGSNSAVFTANETLFPDPAPGTFGTSERNIVTEPGIENFTLGLYKNTNLGEKVTFQLRLEAFNAFNHPQFYADPVLEPGGNVSVNNARDSGQLGLIGAAAQPRILQIGGKIVF
ncbi:MAG: TonB-dependent receptor plug domain-containing protein, partial [Acidobacteriaceae bacterium]